MDNNEVEVNAHVQPERYVNHQQGQLINQHATFHFDVQNKETSDGELIYVEMIYRNLELYR